jgi:hypothetical protein
MVRDLHLFKLPMFELRVVVEPPLLTQTLGLYFLASPFVSRRCQKNCQANSTTDTRLLVRR